ncbi:MAG: hypothetical protein V8S14_00710 [Lachnospiraceae bacterium]
MPALQLAMACRNIMKPINYDEMRKLLTDMHEELDREYDEKINHTGWNMPMQRVSHF